MLQAALFESVVEFSLLLHIQDLGSHVNGTTLFKNVYQKYAVFC
jgi:hypothetical protein